LKAPLPIRLNLFDAPACVLDENPAVCIVDHADTNDVLKNPNMTFQPNQAQKIKKKATRIK